MKKNYYLVFSLLAIIVLSISCSANKSENIHITPSESSTFAPTNVDTTDVLEVIDSIGFISGT